MTAKLSNFILTAALMLFGAMPVLVPAAATAAPGTACTNISQDIAAGANDAAGTNRINCNERGDGSGSLTSIGRTIVNFLSILIGIVAIIMIIYAGFRYITSAGDSGRVGNAKNTLIYAVIGLIIVALAQVLVKFVLFQTDKVS